MDEHEEFPLIELIPTQFQAVVSLFNRTRYGVLAAGTLEGGHPGRVFVDDPDNPSVGLVCTRVGYYFLAGQPAKNAETLPRLFKEDLGPAQLALTGDPQILLFYDSPAWQPVLFDAFRRWQPQQIYKKRMVLGPGAAEAARSHPLDPPEQLSLTPVTQELLERYPDRLDETLLFWGSVEAFLRRGLGVWVMDGKTITSSCESVFTGAGEVEISISTIPDYRCQGLARLAGTAFLQACLARGLNPVWGCWPENEPSVALARRLGFVDDCDQAICLFELENL